MFYCVKHLYSGWVVANTVPVYFRLISGVAFQSSKSSCCIGSMRIYVVPMADTICDLQINVKITLVHFDTGI